MTKIRGEMPLGYEDLVHQATNVLILWQNKGQLRIWGPEEVVAMNQAYNIAEYAPGAVAFADNGAGQLLIYGTGLVGRGIFIVETGSVMLDEDADFVSADLNGVLLDGQGADLIFQSDLVNDDKMGAPFMVDAELR